MINISSLLNSKIKFDKIKTAPKFEQGKTKIKTRHNEFIKTLFIKIDKPDILFQNDEYIITSIPYVIKKCFDDYTNLFLRNTYTNSSFIEAVLLCLDSDLNLTNDEKDRKQIIEKYQSVLDFDLRMNSFWNDTPSNKSELKRQIYGNNNCDILGKMMSNSLSLNIILLNCESNEINFIENLNFKDKKPIIIIVKKYNRYFPLMTSSGAVFDTKENEILKILEEIGVIELIKSEEASSSEKENISSEIEEYSSETISDSE